MNNAAPALLALLLVCALPATAVVAAGPTSADVSAEQHANIDDNVIAADDPVTAENTTNRLQLDGDVRNSDSPARPDFGTALAIRDDAFRAEYETFQFEAELEDGTNAERRALVEDEHERIGERVTDLNERERAAVSAHANGTLTDDELLQTLVQISTEAAELETRLGEVDDYAKSVGMSIETEPEEGSLDTHQSTVRDRIATAMSGTELTTQSSTTVAIQTSETGVTIAMIDGVEYVRETARYDNRNPTAQNQFNSYSNAHTHITELYPWTFGEGSSGHQALVPNEDHFYGFTVPHDHGELTAYLDGGTGAIFHETQILRISQLPTEQLEQTWTNDAVKLTVNQTPANGPIEVTVTDDGTDEPVGATIHINGTVVGETGQDGSVWIVPPHGDYELAAQTPETTVNASVSASPLQ